MEVSAVLNHSLFILTAKPMLKQDSSEHRAIINMFYGSAPNKDVEPKLAALCKRSPNRIKTVAVIDIVLNGGCSSVF